MADQENNQNLACNPFAALFSSPGATQFSSGPDPQSVNSMCDSVAENNRSIHSRQEFRELLNINNLIQRIFLITLDNSDASIRAGNEVPPRCVYLEEMAADLNGQTWLDMDNVEQALFNRLLLQESGDQLVHVTSGSEVKLPVDFDAVEQCIPYLYACYQRAKEEVTKVPETLLSCAVRCKNLAVSNARTVLLIPEIYSNHNVYGQLVDLLLVGVGGAQPETLFGFMEEVIAGILTEQEVRTFREVITPVLDDLQGRIKDLDLYQLFMYSYLDVLVYFSRQREIAKVLVEHIQPKHPTQGFQYQNNLLGLVLSISCLPKTPGKVESHGYFLNPTHYGSQEKKAQEANIHQLMGKLHDKLHQVLKNLLQHSSETRHQLLFWLGGCLQANAGRTKIWANQRPEIFQSYASDAFFLNLGAALLKLCQPFCRPLSPKLLTFEPSYCALKDLSEDERRIRNVHARGLDKETCLIPVSPQQPVDYVQSYSLLTENLIFTQLTLRLGFHRLQEQMVKMDSSIYKLEHSLHDARQTGSSVSEHLLGELNRLMTAFLSTKAALTEPGMLQCCMNLQASSAALLVQLGLGNQGNNHLPLNFPLMPLHNSKLCYVPEFFMENIGDFIIFLHRFADNVLESSAESIEQILNLVTVFMGSADRMNNPHLRAKLVEVLNALTPYIEPVSRDAVQPVTFQRERVFCSYRHASSMAEALITMFVDIEFTGDPHHFTQKFYYRRPMYAILKYMWGKDVYRESIKHLADYASENLEATNPPLFLRYINLLMNDAIFLLDEAIQYLSKIKLLQLERDQGEWDGLAPDARREKESDLQKFGELGRFHNIVSNETISTLALLTSEIKSIFVHPFLAERMVSMLNYFLQHLVGPKMGALKVKDFSEFDFKPQQLVSDICTIYLNLGEEDNFCAMVPKDGRSYSPTLFSQAVRVLKKINKPGPMVVSFGVLADKIKSHADRLQQEEETYSDAPDDFLDPIMSTLMRDPVILPSSRVTVDRSTIARHLLSDQTDPFNRCPLTMDQIRSNEKLKQEISQWLAKRQEEMLQKTGPGSN